MPDAPDITNQLRRDLDATRLRLAEAEETLEAIRQGEADGLVISGPQGPQVFTLQGAMEPYRQLIEQMSEGALTLSRDGVILYANQSLAAMLQLPLGRVIGTTLRDFFPAAAQAAIAGLIETAWNGSSSGDVSIRTAVGSTVPLRLCLNRLQLGAETLISAVATNITVEKQREIDSRGLADLLEARVAERTADLAVSQIAALNMMEEALEGHKADERANRELSLEISERKLLQDRLSEALIAAQAGNRAKSEFLGIMSHELRTPLNGVLGCSELLTGTPLDGEQKSLVETISECGGHLLEIVRDILDFSNMEAGKLAIDVAPAAVAELVEQSAMVCRKSAAAKGLAFRCETSGDVPRQIAGDALRIRQILINLLGNAIKFTASGSVVLRVAPGADGRFLDFAVEDTGIGISSEMIGLIFKSFTQADSTTSRRFGGTGLGLAISKRLAEVMGGSITVVSTPAKGSTFTFHFPLQPTPDCTGGLPTVPAPGSAQQANHAARTVPRPPLQTGGTAAEGKLVLVVEDDTVNSRLAGKMLHSLGYRAEFAADGFEALSAFVPEKYFAILMDMVMPGMDGVEATKRIRAVQSASRVSIIALTANVMPGDRELCLAADMDDFLAKPYSKAELAAKLGKILG